MIMSLFRFALLVALAHKHDSDVRFWRGGEILRLSSPSCAVNRAEFKATISRPRQLLCQD